MNKIALILLKSMIYLLSKMPLTLNRRLGKTIGLLMTILKNRMYHTSRVNLEKCYPLLSPSERKILLKKSCENIGICFTETAWFWGKDIKYLNEQITEVSGLELFDKYKQDGKGVIVVGLHLGNWELFSQWFPQYVNVKMMYKALKSKELDEYISKKRSKTGACMVQGKRENIVGIMKHIKNSGVFFVCHDQEPKKGSGVFADFYNTPAYRMTIAQKLAMKTDAELVFVTMYRNDNGFEVNFEELKFDYRKNSLEEYARQLNRKFEEKINVHPEQYQWSYKLFKSTPDGSPNPYTK